MSAFRRCAATLLVTGVLLGIAAMAVSAHPLGNFTANTAAALELRTDAIVIDYVLDLAEIPALQARQGMGPGGGDPVGGRELSTYGQQRCDELRDGLVIDVGRRSLTPRTVGADAAFQPGEAGLDTLRVSCRFSAAWELSELVSVTFVDTNTPDRAGWREVSATGVGAHLRSSDVPAASPTGMLRSYPDDRLDAPLDVRSATLTVGPGEATTTGTGDGVLDTGGATGLFERLTSTYTSLVAAQDLTPAFALTALALSLVLGAMHALAPGHGKTVMAAYVVGQRGTTRQAVFIGLTVAATHTIGVLGLGIAISASQTLAPGSLYPWLGAASGLLVVGIGIGLLRRSGSATSDALTGSTSHGPSDGAVTIPAGGSGDDGHPGEHVHHHDHQSPTVVRSRTGSGGFVEIAHVHGGSSHVHPIPGPERITGRSLVTLGVAGGLVPSPSALLVLLGALALGRAWFGVGLVASYGVGMAATLVVAGLLLVRLRGRVEHLLARSSRRWHAGVRWLPAGTAVLVILGGVVLAVRALLMLHA